MRGSSNVRLPHLAIDSFFTNPESTRRWQALDLLDRLDSPRYEEIAHQCCGARTVSRPTRSSAARGGAGMQCRLVRAPPRHRPNRSRFPSRRHPRLIEESEREAILISRREKILDPDHRFFLALLLNVPDREAILSTIASTYGTANPRGLVMQWLSELSGLNTLGIEIDEVNARLLGGLLAGLSFEAICEDLSAEYSADEVTSQRHAIQEQYDRIRNHAPLRPLFNV